MSRPSSSRRAAAAVFVKTPGLTPLKTRLAADLGRDWAEQWHRLAAACVAESIAEAGLAGYWAVAEAAALEHPLWQAQPRLVQVQGSLGERMEDVHRRLLQAHHTAILLGADLPQLQPRPLLEASAWLDHPRPRAVIGPARDGGFWLFGSNRGVPLDRWTAVGYSRADTAVAFRASLGEGFDWLELEFLTDLDRAQDLPRVRAELAECTQPLPAQRALLGWLDANPGALR